MASNQYPLCVVLLQENKGDLTQNINKGVLCFELKLGEMIGYS